MDKNEEGEFVSPWDIPDSTEDFVSAEELTKQLENNKENDGNVDG